ncbi:carbohydrate-binding protein [Coraliomargarita akajimensis]|uniref:Carbohydrate binding family 6 n=1 Tax=Coraliomargarita akajimensis (strain DSM 45221 / IAM 15411 / JCM 23193 / KCTC 12865 / 04OKA010-24) TaxID=583355 RepID=D5EL46_CORAD|nr:carbohydrate-binding protein [Coraliomargarita akajimensis]ADE53148.1 Carbohydrate binding family 6 [Coraliomargarita akajimensis DSM 45221]
MLHHILNKITLTAACAIATLSAHAQQAFNEENGRVIWEVESQPAATGWTAKTAVNDYTGSSYYEWTGPNYWPVAQAGNGTITYRVKINTAGNYRFQWRNRILVGTNGTEHNDNWVQFPTGEDVPGQWALQKKWTKCYNNTINVWSWNTWTKDNDSRAVIQYFSAGVHEIKISGRSNGHGIDRLTLYNIDTVNFNANTFTNAPQSPLVNIATGNGTPYGGTAWAIPGSIEAEDYNVGGQGVAYSDATTGNTGSSSYRADGVDLWDGNAQDPARLVGAIADGEYLNYDVNVTPGVFDIVARVAVPDNTITRSIEVTIDGISLGSVDLTSTGGWRNFQDFTIPNVTLGIGGLREVQLKLNGGSFNLDKVSFNPALTSGPFKYDFGSSTSPLEAGYTRITETTTTGEARWTSATGLQQRLRGAPAGNSLDSDMNLSQTPCTFSVNLANGTYSVKVRLGDVYAHNDNITISAEGATQVSGINIAANTYTDHTFTVTVTDNQLDIGLDATAVNGWWTLTAIEITEAPAVSLSYDLGTSTSPVEADSTRITELTSTGTARWLNTAGLGSRDRSGVSDSVNRDLVFDNLPAVFAIDVPNGTYTVSVTIGDVYAVDDIVIKAEGTTVASNIDRAVNQWLPVNFTATVSDGTLNLEFSDGGGTNPNWIVNRITVDSQ